jgi:hypothetical protein
MKQEVRELFGGWDIMSGDSKTMTVSGGFTQKNKHLEHMVVIGDITKQFIKNKIIEWDAFKKTYYENGKFDSKHYDKFLKVLNNIFPLPIYTVDENELLFLVTNIYKAPIPKVVNGMLKMSNVFQSLKSAIRHLFMIYKVYIERLVEIYVELRNQYIIKFKIQKTNKFNNFYELAERWNIIDAENVIDTSSPILFFSFHPSNIKFAKSIPKIIWGLKSKDNNHDNVINTINAFLNKIKATNFEYIGYCQHAAIDRFKLLLKFPINHLLKLIKVINIDNTYLDINNSYEKFTKKITKKIRALHPTINIINNVIKSDIKITHMDVGSLQKFTKNTNTQQKIVHFTKYINAFLQLYKDIVPHIIKKEKYINNLAIDINSIASDIQIITNLFII